MSTERWLRVERLFIEALEQPSARRADFLADSGVDAGMRDEVAALLTAAEQSGEFLSVPALDVFAQQISREGWSVQPGDRIGVLHHRAAAGRGRDG